MTISTGTWTAYDGGTSATLTLIAKSYRNGYQYKCKVSNAIGYVYSNAVTLTVNVSFIAVRMKLVMLTPGISTGY